MPRFRELAYPLLRYNILENARCPTMPAIAFRTKTGTHLYLVTREILEELAREFSKQAARTPKKSDLN